ncbi:PREDICTED: adenylate cyclase type 10-like [Trachymyrmex cornetzi]|uniref:adenylate cyclase type 10-like n=1 Tax=Trachymyrmex cornetzi TaxID=471704 RepID=UPI00084F31C1|nr:PREDICTED: adenylate cyclase type 10-like [Trachymyrmex cornetzi]
MSRNINTLVTEIYNSDRSSRARLEQHTKIFASMCPDEILDYYDNYETREYDTTLMLGDVSGFTDLTEKYTKTGVGGPSKLSETLNSYIGAMVQEILSHNGDVVKFSGDAFIVMWKLQEGMLMRDIATEAMQTACIIQKHFGTYTTDVGVSLRVKLAIASGITYFTSIGDPETMSYYVITGKPVWDVKFAEGLCRGGDILVAPSSWQWANPSDYVYEKLPNGIHTLIIACSAMWYQSRPHDIHDVRPKVIKAAKEGLKDSLRSYMLRPVIRSVEMDEPLEYLTEMRQVVILFINIITTVMDNKELISLVNVAYKLVYGVVCEMNGCVNKTSLFDKDLIFLCIFGLRGDKHVLESQIGLRCASRVRQNLLAIKNVQSVTIAVTTGMTYCGVVGHVLRREYTVIGMSVNKAARLMVAYNNKVICDRESFLHSRLEARHFILQEPRHMKGITNVGPVYEFQEQIKFTMPVLIRKKYPLLGRQEEIKIFRQMLSNLITRFTRDVTTQHLQLEHNMLIIKGEPRIGKTRLLNEITQNIPANIPRNYISLVMSDAKTSYSLIHLIFSIPLGFSVVTTPREREEILMSRLGPIRKPEFLCALNQPFNVHFMMNSQYTALSRKQKHNVLRKFLLKLMKNCFKELWVIIIDDTQHSDNDSMKLFRTMIEQNTVFFILSFGRMFNSDYEIYSDISERARIIELGCIDKWYHAALACQFLDASGISPELERLIQEKSFGNPGWIESYLLSLTQSGSLVTMHISKTIAEEMGYNGSISSMMLQTIIHKTEMPIYDETIAVYKFTEGFVPEEGDAEMTMDAVKKLFEIRIFGCARGDFTMSSRPLVFGRNRNIREPILETQIACECVNLMIPGKQDIILTAILEFVEICLANNNVPQAHRLLNDAETLTQQIVEFNEEKSIFLFYLTAKIQTFQGKCHLESGLISEASKKLKEAMISLGYHFPQRKFAIGLKSTTQLELLRWRLICPKRWNIDTADELTINYIEQLANCLALMFVVFKGTKYMKKHARLAAIWSLNAALDASNDFLTLCTSFTNMMIIAHVYQTKSIVPYLEKEALSICAKKGDLLELQELKVIAELYAGIFFSRWLRGEINKAIRIGFITMRMAQTMDSVFLKLLILPRLVHLLMISCRHSEVVTLLRKLEFVSRNVLDKSSRTWYYAMCADVQLDTGLALLSFQNCDKYYNQEGETIISLHDPEAERRYFTSMWLWCIRTQQWEATKVWSSRNVTAESIMDEHKVAATITALKKLEGLLILYVREITNRNINALQTFTEIKHEFRHIKSMIKIVKIAVPRYMLMKAYYYMIQLQKSAAIKMLQKTKKLCIKVDNRMIYAWANHCQQDWLGAISFIHKDLWIERTKELHDEWDEVNANDSKMIPYTFPLPKYML